MALKSLEQHNAETAEAFLDAARPKPNGIACPNCGEELWDSAPGTQLPSCPPKKNVHCPDCNWSGYANA